MMKFQKTRLIFLIIILFSTIDSYSQRNANFSGGVDYAFPLGNFKNYYTHGIGPSLGVDYKFTYNFAIYFTAAYMVYTINKSTLDVSGSEPFIPLEIGAKYYVTPQAYVMGGGGVNLDLGNTVTPYKVFHGGVGYMFLHDKLLSEIKYERTGVFDFTPKVIKLRVAYVF